MDICDGSINTENCKNIINKKIKKYQKKLLMIEQKYIWSYIPKINFKNFTAQTLLNDTIL